MADNGLNKRFFTNTYITGSGRHNYLRIDELEDPLFTSFTFDIDYVSSPLFYTINYSDYGYPNVEGIGERIEDALIEMYGENITLDQGYEILPTLSASILDGNKLGFGLQQNVYMDLPLYGAAEYIYMVDKRNGGSDQNDVRFDNNKFVDSGGNPNALNSYKLGDSIKEIVNDSDARWTENQKKQHEEQIDICNDILNDEDVQRTHMENKNEMDSAKADCDAIRGVVDGVEYNESELMNKMNECKKKNDVFEQFKLDIVSWANGWLSQYQNKGTTIYTENKCVQKIFTYDGINNRNKETYAEMIEKEFGKNFREERLFTSENSYVVKFKKLYNEIVTYTGKNAYDDAIKDDGKSFLLDKERGDGRSTIRPAKILEKFSDKLKYFGLYNEGDKEFNGSVYAYLTKTPPDWATKVNSHLSWFATGNKDYKDESEMVSDVMSYQCDIDLSFGEDFTSDIVKNNEKLLDKYEIALDEVRTALYGFENGEICDMYNPSPNSPYGQYISAKDKYENDEYSQAEKIRSIAQSGASTMGNMISRDEYEQSISDSNYNESIKKDAQPLEINRDKSIVPAQTVLDMLGFISGMKKMTMEYPYIIQGITGLDTAYNKHYGIKDPYPGSGDDKITLTCLESLDLRVSSMFNRYFNAIYDRQYRRERVPVNLRRFNCSIYVHDVRNFVARDRVDKNGNRIVTYNRILELTDMYHSVIEFRFYDCEIVPEETGNIFNDVSNEAPSEMKKTNFTFTYGNCVVNFVPSTEVAAHNIRQKKGQV